MTRFGTSFFPTKKDAILYYNGYHTDSAGYVNRAIEKGEIHIGIPQLKDGEELYLFDEKPGLRWFIKTKT